MAYFSCLLYLSGSSHSMVERITESFFGQIAACYRNLFQRLSGYSAWLVNELAFGVWLVAGGMPWIRLFVFLSAFVVVGWFSNRTSEVADLFGSG